MTVWLLGDQLNPGVQALEHDDQVLLVEAHGFADRLPYHVQKLALVFSAMRQFRDELRARGYEVTYLQRETFAEALDAYFAAVPGDSLVLLRPPSHGAASRLRELVSERGGDLSVVENDRFLTTPAEFDAWAGDGAVADGFRHEHWYRHVRRERDVLMDGGDPVGGEWNYDDRNRETPPEDWSPPPVRRFEPDETTREVLAWVEERYPDAWGSADDFGWPVTRTQALEALDQFVSDRLPVFGPYQDAMVDGRWALAHSLLSPALNLGLLHPAEVVSAAEAAYDAGDAPLNSVEGFVRQVLGWREFVRHVYRRAMPAMGEANQLSATRSLPELYYTGETAMRCLEEAVGHVWHHGYAHHIERLMVLSNFALIFGADPHELNRWFHLGFVDAYHWVTTPNVVGMGTFATDVLSSKPYAASGNYVDRMSDYCGSCRYDVDETTGDAACPFNALYWDFLRRNESALRNTGRMGLVYANADRKDADEWDRIADRVGTIRDLAADGDL
jgi:deoxyribodipyrimidine photolyase-related protein